MPGALGHIGSSLIRALPARFPGAHLFMVDDLSTQRYSSLFHLPQQAHYHFIEGRAQDIELEPLVSQAHVVIHLAALTDAAGTASQPERVHQNNFEATKKLADICLRLQTPFIFPSSTSVYGSQSALVDETCTALHPQSPYAACKIKEEDYLLELFQQGLKGAICRLGTIYGPSPGMRFHTAVNKFCWQAVMGQDLTVWETALDQKRPYLSVEDATESFAHIISNALFGGEIYNIVSGNHTVRDVIENIQSHIPEPSVTLVKHEIMNQLSYEVSHLKFTNTGFSFQGSLAQGIKETVDLLKQANA